MESPDDLIARRAVQFRHDPLGWARYAYDWGHGDLAKHPGPRAWQAEALQKIGDHLSNPATRHQPLRLAVASGHGIGKSACIGMVTNWGMSTMPHTRCVVTANTENQLRTKTWPEIAKWARMSINAHWWQVPAMSIYAGEPGGEKSWRGDAIPWSENNTEAFAGLHNEGRRIILIFDEGSKIADKVWEVAEGALTDADTEILWLVFGNPTQNTGRFRECFGKYRHQWVTKQIDSRTVEGTNKQYLQEFADTHGEDSDVVRVRIKGEFPRQSASQFISSQAVENAEARKLTQLDPGAPLILGVDIARFGDDKSVIRGRKGRDGRVIPPIKWAGQDTVFSAGKVAEAIEKYKPEAVFIDGGGVGGGVVDILKAQNYRVTEVNFGSAARDGNKYANKRAEMWGELRDWMETGAIDTDPELHDDLIAPEYSFDKNSKILLEKKEDMKSRGLASPDNGDALALTFAAPVARTDMRSSRGVFAGRQMSSTDYSVLG
jgi:hypothetical protein